MVKNLKLLITGSEGLIGRELCRYFADRFEILKLDLALGHDLTNEKFVGEWFKKNKDLYGLIICHAHNPIAPLKGSKSKKIEPHDIKPNEVRDFFEVNSISPFIICQHFVKNNKNGLVINVSSLYGSVSPRHDIYRNFVKPIGYSMSKAALQMMTKYLAAYYGPDFRFNTVILGGVPKTGSSQDATFVKAYSKHTPLKRLMKIEEVTSVFDFLLNEKSSYVTGAEIFVDGGWTAW